MNRSVSFVAAVYAILVIILGIMGFQAGSAVSMVSGLISGIIMLFSAYHMSLRKTWSYVLGTIVALILLIVFCIRFGKTTDFMPGAMAIFSLIVAAMVWVQAYHLIRKK
jgi:uncharacterized membrane protein (UPF0136 family)